MVRSWVVSFDVKMSRTALCVFKLKTLKFKLKLLAPNSPIPLDPWVVAGFKGFNF